jgi:hypothetical protein
LPLPQGHASPWHGRDHAAAPRVQVARLLHGRADDGGERPELPPLGLGPVTRLSQNEPAQEVHPKARIRSVEMTWP